MDLWYTEYQTKNAGITLKTKSTIHREKSDYQDIAIIDTEQYGRMLVIDGTVQTSIEDEYIYHEMITHVPLFTHPNPQNVLVIGGGDGGAIREIIKHSSVKKAVLVEIDGKVVDTAKKYLPEISCALGDKRVEVLIDDGIEYVKNNSDRFDVIIIDSTDPIGPATGLFNYEFYKSIYGSLKEDGLFVAQTESPFFHKKLIKSVHDSIKKIFPITKVYVCPIPTYPSGYWSFTMGSKKHNPMENGINSDIKTVYYTGDIHRGAFALPRFLDDYLKSE